MNPQLDLYKINKGNPIEGFKDYSLAVAREGIVLLKNDNNLLPLINKKIAVFGRIQNSYYKSGTGSGGLVNVLHVSSIIEGLLANPLVEINSDILKIYNEWTAEHPFNAGNGMWASEPWSQKEMPLNDEIVEKAAKESEVAVIVIGRTAGEDRDNYSGEGSYQLSKEELEMIDTVTRHFKNTVLVLNVGNIIDMSFMDGYDITSVLYVWHGGMEGGIAVSDILTGVVAPSGKLSDTIPYSIEDLPAFKNFGGYNKNFYAEDIYVGYRYFNTFALDKIRFPFGFGLTYTKFDIKTTNVLNLEDKLIFKVKVSNIGNYRGKEVVQVYVECPQGKLGKPSRQLVGFNKTKELNPGESQELEVIVLKRYHASFDDTGVTGNLNCFVFEAGNYAYYVGNSSIDNVKSFEYTLDDLIIIEQCHAACEPCEEFDRIVPSLVDGKLQVSYQKVLPKKETQKDHIAKEKLPLYTTDKEGTLEDVEKGILTLEEFVASLDVEDLIMLARGEGMSSYKVTSGTAAAYGAVSKSLVDKGIPICCASDGPSGIRMDSGQQATSMPNGTCIACTMNEKLIEELYYLEGKELISYNIDTLLGPGMNIHRFPLNGRNFEYFSEDPYLTGMMARAVTKGLQTAGATGTLKHMACNNQEFRRFDCDSILSSRALREIYLRGFEIAVREGKSRTIMTCYNPLNGIWGASNYDLNTLIVRKEWGFDGLIMTDWWAKMNDEENGPAERNNSKAMIIAQNDIYMVTGCPEQNSANDNSLEAYNAGILSKEQLQRVAKNILSFIMKTPVWKRKLGLDDTPAKLADNVQRIVKNIKVDGTLLKDFNSINHFYYLSQKDVKLIEVDTEFKYDVVYPTKTCDTAIVRVYADNMTEVYYINFNTEAKKHDVKLIDLDNATLEHNITVYNKPWYTAELDLSKYSAKTKLIEVDENNVVTNCQKNESISYAVDIESYGKYIIAITMKCDAPMLAQVPFSIFVDQVNKSTLTSGSTNGNFVEVNSHIVIVKGQHHISFRFNTPGISIAKVKIIKHM